MWIWRLVTLGVLAAAFAAAIAWTEADGRGCTFPERSAPSLLSAAILLFLVAFYPLQRWRELEKRPARVNLTCLGCLFLLVAIVFPLARTNLMGAPQRGKQKRTMSDMRTLATAMESYAVDNLRYPEVRSIDELVPLMEPTYVRRLPARDGWRDRFWIRSGATSYTILSYGKCCRPDYPDPWQPPPGPTGHYTNDILFSNGEFVVYPEGSQE